MESNTNVPEKKDRRSPFNYASRVVLDGNYYLTHSRLSWVLHAEKPGGINQVTKKPGTRREEWYFPTVKLCLKKYLDLTLSDTMNEKQCEVIELFGAINRAEAKIEELCKK